MGVFHATFSVELHFTGNPLSGLVPLPVGPRQCGQSAAERSPAEVNQNECES